MADAKVIHFEIVGRDQKALQAYYGNLFGWKLDTSAPGGYGMTDPAATGVVVGVGATPDGSAGHVTGYVTVSSIDATLPQRGSRGGSGGDLSVRGRSCDVRQCWFATNRSPGSTRSARPILAICW